MPRSVTGAPLLRLLVLIITISIAVQAGVSPSTVRAQRSAAATDDAYREMVRRALAEFGHKNWKQAQALFRSAHALQPSARTLRGLGMVAFEMQDYVESHHKLQAALEDARKPLEGKLREDTQALLARARSAIGRVRVRVSPPWSSLQLDGAPVSNDRAQALWVRAGRHVLTATATGYTAQRHELEVGKGAALELDLRLQRVTTADTPTPIETRHSHAVAASLVTSREDRMRDHGALDGGAITDEWWFWAGAGVLAVGIGASVVLLASGDEAPRRLTPGTDGVVITTLSLP